MPQIRIVSIFLLFSCFISFSQENFISRNWLRSGVVYGFSSQNTYISQDSDYEYESQIFKMSNHFNLSKKERHSWEILVEPSYYRSKHESFNYWHAFFTKNQSGAELRDKYMPLKNINEYVLNLGIIYRYNLNLKWSVYAMGNVGPMYMDTDTERMKKGFAFSDIFGLGSNYKVGNFSFDVKTMIRHVSNANFQYPNFGYNAVGFEFGAYYEFK